MKILFVSDNPIKGFGGGSQRMFKVIGTLTFFSLFLYAVYSYRMQGSHYNPLIPYDVNFKLFG